MAWIAAAAAGLMLYLWLKAEAEWASEREEWHRQRRALRQQIEEEHHSPGGVTIYEAACQKAKDAYDRDFAATLSEILSLPEAPE